MEWQRQDLNLDLCGSKTLVLSAFDATASSDFS